MIKSQVDIAAGLAVIYHNGQMYGDNTYFYHLVQVDNLVTQLIKSRVVKNGLFLNKARAAAFLHDIIEDTECTGWDLSDAGIEDDVVEAVLLVTKRSDQPYDEYIEHIKVNELARTVKICDTAANLSNSLIEVNMKRIKKYSKQLEMLGGFK